MFGKKKRDREEGRKRADAYERYRHRTKKGKSLSAAAADLCNIADRDKLLEVAEQVLKQTQAEEADIFQKYDRSVPGPPGKGDWATWPGAFITEVIRQHSCDPQTVWNALG
jgi:hypothetical protein